MFQTFHGLRITLLLQQVDTDIIQRYGTMIIILPSRRVIVMTMLMMMIIITSLLCCSNDCMMD